MNLMYVYSGTGNTLHLAERLSERIGEHEIHNMVGLMDEDVHADGETVGIFYPVHAFGAPAVVHRFLSRLSVKPSSWVYLVLDSAGTPLGAAAQCRRILKKRGIRLDASFSVKMPGNYPPLYNPPSGEKLRRLAQKGDLSMDGVIEAVLTRKGSRSPNKLLGILSEFINSGALRAAPRGDSKFFSTDECTGCGICASVCPVDNVKIVDGRPTWLGNCTGCLSCFHWCPSKAIQYNRGSSFHRNRYGHPSIPLERYLDWCSLGKEEDEK